MAGTAQIRPDGNGALSYPKIQFLGKGVVENGFTVCRRIIVEDEGLFLELAVKAGPVLPGFEDRKIKALAVVGAEEISVSLFADRIRTVHSSSLKSGHLCFSSRFHLYLLSAYGRLRIPTSAKNQDATEVRSKVLL
jgi:hypothetical protein